MEAKKPKRRSALGLSKIKKRDRGATALQEEKGVGRFGSRGRFFQFLSRHEKTEWTS